MGQCPSRQAAKNINSSIQGRSLDSNSFEAHYARAQLLKKQRDDADRRSLLLARECRTVYQWLGEWHCGTRIVYHRPMRGVLKKAELDDGALSLEILDRELLEAEERGDFDWRDRYEGCARADLLGNREGWARPPYYRREVER